MARYTPSKPFDVPMYLYPVMKDEIVLGVPVKTYAEKGVLFFGSFITYGGTETTTNGVLSVEDTANVETWYKPEFAANGRIALANEPAKVYEIVGEPENIEQRYIYSKMKLRRVKGGA